MILGLRTFLYLSVITLCISCKDQKSNVSPIEIPIENDTRLEEPVPQTEEIKILVPASFSSKDYDPTMEQLQWSGLFLDEDKRLTSDKVELNFENIRCPMTDKANEKSGKKISFSESTKPLLFAISGVEFTTNEKISPYPNMKSELLPYQSMQLGDYTIKCIGRVGGHSSIWDYKLVISGLKHGKQIEQIFLEQEWFDDAMIQFEWAGDLDNDGLPDLYMNTSHKYSFSNMVLFLSSHAAEKELIKLVSEIRLTGC